MHEDMYQAMEHHHERIFIRYGSILVHIASSIIFLLQRYKLIPIF